MGVGGGFGLGHDNSVGLPTRQRVNTAMTSSRIVSPWAPTRAHINGVLNSSSVLPPAAIDIRPKPVITTVSSNATTITAKCRCILPPPEVDQSCSMLTRGIPDGSSGNHLHDAAQKVRIPPRAGISSQAK